MFDKPVTTFGGDNYIIPHDPEESKARKLPVYYVPRPCNDCNSYAHKRYVKDDKCKSCITKEATATVIMVHCLKGKNDHVNWETQEIWVSPNVTKDAKPWKLPDDVWERVIDTAMIILADPSLQTTFQACPKESHILIKNSNGKCYHCSNMKKQSPRQEAIRNGETWYTPSEVCPKCGKRDPRRVSNGQCKGCIGGSEKSPRQHALHNKDRTYMSERECRVCGSHERATKTSQCTKCKPLRTHKKGLSPRQKAIENGDKFFMPYGVCEVCNTISARRVNNSQCTQCELNRRSGSITKGLSPRQLAIENGDKWYSPDTPCKKCNTLSDRSVNNGECKGCRPKQGDESPRQKAADEGEYYYLPNESCDNCNTRSLRRVKDNLCKGC